MSRTVIAFIVLSLLGLIIIQVGMLRIGLIKESESYNSEVSAVMLDVSTKLFEDTKLSEQIATLSKETDIDKRTIFNTDSLPFSTRKKIDLLFKKQLEAREISVGFAFALTDSDKNIILTAWSMNYANVMSPYIFTRKP